MTAVEIRARIYLGLIAQPKLGDRPQRAWYVQLYRLLSNGNRVYTARRRGPFSTLRAAHTAARWALAHHNEPGATL